MNAGFIGADERFPLPAVLIAVRQMGARSPCLAGLLSLLRS